MNAKQIKSTQMNIGTQVKLQNTTGAWITGIVISCDRAKVAGKTKTLLEIQLPTGSTRLRYSTQCVTAMLPQILVA